MHDVLYQRSHTGCRGKPRQAPAALHGAFGSPPRSCGPTATAAARRIQPTPLLPSPSHTPRRVPRPRATSRRPVTQTHAAAAARGDRRASLGVSGKHPEAACSRRRAAAPRPQSVSVTDGKNNERHKIKNEHLDLRTCAATGVITLFTTGHIHEGAFCARRAPTRHRKSCLEG